MYIANNVISNALKNVYWVLGGACGGKTTAARILSEKYGMIHYNADDKMWSHKQMANYSEQPAMDISLTGKSILDDRLKNIRSG